MEDNEALDKALKLLAKKLPPKAIRAGLDEMEPGDQELIIKWLGK